MAICYTENCDRSVLLDAERRIKMGVEYKKYNSGAGKAKMIRPPQIEGTNTSYIRCEQVIGQQLPDITYLPPVATLQIK